MSKKKWETATKKFRDVSVVFAMAQNIICIS